MMRLLFLSFIFLLMLLAAVALAFEKKNILMYFPFDEDKGDTAKDASGNQNDGTLAAGAKFTKDGKIGGAAEFSGNSFMRVNDSPTTSPRDAITIAAWINVESRGEQNIVGQDSSYQLQLEGGGNIQAQYNRGADWSYTAAGPYPINEWFHAAITYDGKKAACYQNGAEIATGAVTGQLQDATNPVCIASWQCGGSEWVQGRLDEVAVFDIALSEKEIKSITEKSIGKMFSAAEPKGKLATVLGEIKSGIYSY